ncbi:hypothetical protein KI387_008594, partial [Taxus chinensis]
SLTLSRNDWDPDDNHVGIDVNSTSSKKIVSLSNETAGSDSDLNNGKYWDAWVDYNGGPRQLQVFLLYNPSGNINNISKPQKPILSYDIDLREFLPESITVGLSASTGFSAETHTVHVWNFSCEYSWEIPTSAHPNDGSDEGNEKSSTSVKVILISVFASVVAVVCFIFVGRWWNFRKIKRGGEESHESDAELDEWFAQGPRRGILPGTAETVAVKKISQGSKQGKKEYVSEVTIISKLRHRNLVQLLGWCHEKGILLLVYEYLPNGSLDKYIFEGQKAKLDWNRRYSIACDIASALLYLHEEWDQRVVHRDVKASNVLLDADFNGKLGDFGLARLMERESSFGAVTLAIACGRRPLDRTLIDHNCRLVEWVWDFYGQRRVLDAADENLGGNFNAGEMERLLLVGLLCSHPDPKARPTMREVFNFSEIRR